MEKLFDGVYKISLGNPETYTFVSFREYAAKSVGEDHPAPFTDSDIEFRVNKQGCIVETPLKGDVYGFGLQLRSFCHTMKKRVLRCNADAISNNGESHAPVPFFVTTAGWGLFVDSARDVSFFCGQTRKKATSRNIVNSHTNTPEDTFAAYRNELMNGSGTMHIEIPCAQGVDLYIFAGADMLDAVQKFNMFCGGGAMLPEWSLGAWYRMYSASTAEDWVRFAEGFRKDKLDISVLGLEPGWQTHAYSCTFTFDDSKLGDSAKAINRMHELGYKVNLWEHCFTHPDAPCYEDLLPLAGDYEVWGGIVPDFSIPETRKIFLKAHETHGADCYKLDECDGSDHTGGWSYPEGTEFPSGLDGEQMHHLLGLLYQQTMNEGFPDSCHSVRASGAMASPYPFVLYSDLYDHRDYIRGVVNAGFSGLLWSPEVRDAVSIKDFVRRLQTALFSPIMNINAWYLKNPPWQQLDRTKNNQDILMPESEALTETVRELLRVRTAFVPYLLSMYQKYHDTGKPVFRALILDYPHDLECTNIDDEYLMGDDYLFAPLTAESDTRQVYFPSDGWERNGIIYSKGWVTFTCAVSEYLLFKKVK